MGTMEGWVTRNRLREEQERAGIEQARKEGFDDGYLAGKTFAEQEIAALRARVEELEGMVPKWVPVEQKIALDIQGWLPFDDQKCGQSERLWLMVPPIPLPEGEG